MATKSLLLVCLAAAVSAGIVQEAPLANLAYSEPEEPAYYEYAYQVNDQETGDVKEQKENRQGDAVQGFYTLVQPDGTQRIVEYTASKEHGFNAVVRYEGQPQAAPIRKIAVAAPATYAPAPLVQKVAYAQPVAQVSYAPSPAKIAYAPRPIAQVAYAPQPVAYAQPAHVAKVAYASAPAVYAQAPVTYAQAPVQVAKVAYAQAPVQVAKVTYAPAPVAYSQAPASNIQYAPAPIAQPAKITYSPQAYHVSFTSPAVSYQH